MVTFRRNYRSAQLWGVRASDPDSVVSIYRDAAGLDEDEQLPPGVNYRRMIETILDRDKIDQLSAKVIQAVAG
jgi:hypothetical protein